MITSRNGEGKGEQDLRLLFLGGAVSRAAALWRRKRKAHYVTKDKSEAAPHLQSKPGKKKGRGKKRGGVAVNYC